MINIHVLNGTKMLANKNKSNVDGSNGLRKYFF